MQEFIDSLMAARQSIEPIAAELVSARAKMATLALVSPEARAVVAAMAANEASWRSLGVALDNLHAASTGARS